MANELERRVKKLLFGLILSCFPACVYAGDQEALALNLQKLNLGSLSGVQEKRQYLTTIELEKQKLQGFLLKDTLDNAYSLYKAGDYEGAQELSKKILAIDPTYRDAHILMQASQAMKEGAEPGMIMSEKVIMDRNFNEAVKLYKEGRLAEAAEIWEGILKIQPYNDKADFWLKKTRKEIAEEHIRRGKDAYSRKRYREALDQWYNALLINKNDPGLIALIDRVENELRSELANLHLRKSLELYGDGKVSDAYTELRKVLEIQPSDPKARQLVAEVQNEIASGYVDAGKKSYAQRRYTNAITMWNSAKKWGYDRKYISQLVSRAHEQMRREAQEKKRREEEARRKAEEEAERERQAQEEERKKQQEAEEAAKKAAAAGVETSSTTLPGTGIGPSVTEENKRAAIDRYIKGLAFFQSQDYEKARAEWIISKQLDPTNMDTDAGLKKVEQMLAPKP